MFQLDMFVNQVYTGLEDSTSSIKQLTTLVACTILHKDYVDGVQAVCDMAL